MHILVCSTTQVICGPFSCGLAYLPGVDEDVGSFVFVENHHLLFGRGNIPVQAIQGNTSQQSLSGKEGGREGGRESSAI